MTSDNVGACYDERVKRVVSFVLVIAAGLAGVWFWQSQQQARLIRELRERIDRLTASEVVADVAILEQHRSPEGGVTTRVSFVEYKPGTGETLLAKTFDVQGEELYIDALVVHFEDRFVAIGDGLRGKSLLLFRRAFGNEQKPNDGVPLFTQSSDGHDPVPEPLRIPGEAPEFQRNLWSRFWQLANDPEAAKQAGIRVAQGEAPHVRVAVHQVYQLTLRNSGGLEVKPRLPAALTREMGAIPAPPAPARPK